MLGHHTSITDVPIAFRLASPLKRRLELASIVLSDSFRVGCSCAGWSPAIALHRLSFAASIASLKPPSYCPRARPWVLFPGEQASMRRVGALALIVFVGLALCAVATKPVVQAHGELWTELHIAG